MKKLFFLILFLISSYACAQSVPRWFADELFYPHVTSLGATTWIQLNVNGETSVISGTALTTYLNLTTDYPNQLNTWNASQIFNAPIIFTTGGFLQLKTSAVGNTAYQIWIDPTDSLLYVMDASGTPIPYASKAYNDATYATSGGATDLGATYMTLGTTQTVTGNKTFSGTEYFSSKIRIPLRTTFTTSDDGYLIINSDNDYLYYTSDHGTWTQVVTPAYLAANYPVISNYIPSTGSQLTNTSTLTWTSGTITPKKLSFGGTDAGRTLQLPLDKNRVVELVQGSFIYDYNYTKNLMVWDGSTWLYYPTTTDVDESIASNFSFNAPATETDAETYTFDFEDRNYIEVNFNSISESGLDIYFNNTHYGVVSFTVMGSANDLVLHASNGSGQTAWGTIKYFGGLAIDISNTSARYHFLVKRVNATEINVSYSWAE